ncbi:MAG: DUF721 domain-containing protein [Spirochaeta sp.]|nr:DUF721 domain-containing protein [Spirochaeta sp.]
MSEMKKAGDILKTFFDRSVLAEGEKYLRFFGAWDQIVGPDLSAHAKAIDIVHASVVVEVDHPGWLQLLQLRERNVLKSLHQRFPDLKITGMRYRLVDPENFSAPGREDFDQSSQVSDELTSYENKNAQHTSRKISCEEDLQTHTEDEALSAISDDDLRNGLMRLGEALRRREGDS